jgi:hypothetical protein
MLSLDTAYRSFGGEVESSSTPTICRLSDSCRHQLPAIAPGKRSARLRLDALHQRVAAEYRCRNRKGTGRYGAMHRLRPRLCLLEKSKTIALPLGSSDGRVLRMSARTVPPPRWVWSLANIGASNLLLAVTGRYRPTHAGPCFCKSESAVNLRISRLRPVLDSASPAAE